MVEGKSLLKTVSFTQFDKWDVKRFFINQINSSYPVIFLEKLLDEQTEKQKLSKSPDKEFGILGISNEIGMFDAYTDKGKNINQPYKIIKNDFIAYNPYRINVGSVGIKKDFLKNTYISNAYVVFSTKDNLLADYMYIIMQTSSFNKLIRDNTTGSVRQTLSFENLGKIAIPVPPLEEQKTIIQKYKDAISEADKLDMQASEEEIGIEKFLNEKLELKILNDIQKSHLFFIHLTDLNRWDYKYFSEKIDVESKYKIYKLADFIMNFMNDGKSSLRFESYKKPDDRFFYVGMENVTKNTGEIVCDKLIYGHEIKSQTIRVPRNYFIYGKLRPYLNKYWINENHENVICSSEFFVFRVKDNINKLFFKYLIASDFIQKQIGKKTSGARMPRLNEDDFLNLYIPLPPLSVQEEIVSHVNEIKANVQYLRKQATDLRAKAKKDFENAVFN